ncbi:hypothetical protein [Chitinophaga qingshengii]|uniref:DUF1778 domain-containing protein n=1 Tax=Chitinophaga qingshengii TaxID=1569794 RepID=A0ABR7TTU6_9BACT|nr:hypothetical protein [Chitinophaga qingshengii]MBC9933891.1 hypothetical protein [Chitinophaga qingshengii]
MSNFTLSTLSTLCLVTDSDLKRQQEASLTLTREEQACFEDTKAVLDTVHFSPRAATLRLIFDYAAKKPEQR